VAVSSPPPPPSPTLRPRPRLYLDSFDGVRGLGALVIVVGHLLTFWTSYTQEDEVAPAHPLLSAVGLDYLSSVTMFVVLSGFTLHAVTPPLEPTWASTVSFLRRRALRLAPMYYMGLLLGAVPCFIYTGWVGLLVSLPASGTGVQSLSLVGNDIDGPLWTVSALLLCYCTFPTLQRWARAAQTSSLWRAFWVCAAVSSAVVGVWLGFVVPLLGESVRIIVHVFGPFRLPQFAMGVLAADLAAREVFSPSLARAFVWGGAALMGMNLAASFAYVALTLPNFAGSQTYAYVSEFVLAPVLHSLWLAGLGISGRETSLSTFLASRPFVWLGGFSYAIYCLHFPLMQWISFAAAGGVSYSAVPVVWGWAWANFPSWAILPLLLAAVAVGAVSHYGVERPLHGLMGRGKGGARERKDAGDSSGMGGGEGGSQQQQLLQQ
jgi:peptidoglycan/LPS O-acetylase OafA/YrhL